MKPLILVLFPLLCLAACTPAGESNSVDPVNWQQRKVAIQAQDSLIHGSSYLSVYSEIYERSEKRLFNLTATISIRNISSTDTVYLFRADYFHTGGRLIRTYFDFPIYVAPMETVEIVIAETDKGGGTGANFVFEWAIPPGSHEPFFEAVMISTYGQQGLSFTTQGIKR